MNRGVSDRTARLIAFLHEAYRMVIRERAHLPHCRPQ